MPNWLGNAKVVLTTYETLRDLGFSRLLNIGRLWFARRTKAQVAKDLPRKIEVESCRYTAAERKSYRIGQTKDEYLYYPVVTADFVTFDMKFDKLITIER